MAGVEYPIQLTGRHPRFVLLRLTMPETVPPAAAGVIQRALRRAEDDGPFWAALGAAAVAYGLRVVHTDALADGTVHATLERVRGETRD
jgi:hypothetical protein